MTTTELYDKITARLDELEAIEREATKGPWNSIGMTVRGEHPKGGGRLRLVASFRVDKGTFQQEAWANTNLATEARNLLPGMIAYFRRASKKAHAEYMACEHLYKSATGMEFVRLTDRAEEALRGLHSIARALGMEVGA